MPLSPWLPMRTGTPYEAQNSLIRMELLRPPRTTLMLTIPHRLSMTSVVTSRGFRQVSSPMIGTSTFWASMARALTSDPGSGSSRHSRPRSRVARQKYSASDRL
jgi:hypothetical protein